MHQVEIKANLLEGLYQYNSHLPYFIRLISLNQTQYDEIDSVIDEGIKHIVGRSIVNGYSHFIRGLSQHLGGLEVFIGMVRDLVKYFMMFFRYALTNQFI